MKYCDISKILKYCPALCVDCNIKRLTLHTAGAQERGFPGVYGSPF